MIYPAFPAIYCPPHSFTSFLFHQDWFPIKAFLCICCSLCMKCLSLHFSHNFSFLRVLTSNVPKFFPAWPSYLKQWPHPVASLWILFPFSWHLLLSVIINVMGSRVIFTTKFSAPWGVRKSPSRLPCCPSASAQCLAHGTYSTNTHQRSTWIHKQHKLWFHKRKCGAVTPRKPSQTSRCWNLHIG